MENKTPTYRELMNDFMSFKDDYGKMMQAWYKPTENSRKWRMSSLSVKLSVDNWQLIDTLKIENNWYSTMWFDIGYNPNESGIKW